MPRDERHTETIPYGTLGIIPLASCTEMGKKVDEYLVKWREQRQNENTSTLNFAGYKRDSHLLFCWILSILPHISKRFLSCCSVH